MKTKIQPIVQAVLLLAIVGTGSAWFMAQPGEPDISRIGDIDIERVEAELTPREIVEAPTSRWDHLGQKEIFQPLIPPPTPKPRTPRPPKKLPAIELILRDWRLNYILKNQAEFEDRRTKQVFTMKVGDTRTVSRSRTQVLTVTLTKLSMREFKATFGAPSIENETELTQFYEVPMF